MGRNLKPSTILKKARALIAKGWCKNHLAVDANGDPRPSESPKAVAWCAVGAIYRAGGAANARYSARAFLDNAADGDVLVLNDTSRTRRPVLRAFDRAIALAEKEGR